MTASCCKVVPAWLLGQPLQEVSGTAEVDMLSFMYVLGNSLTDWCSMVSRSGGEDARQQQ